MPTLTLRPRLPEDLPVLWKWTRATPSPEWQRWDGPYFTNKPSPVPFDDYVQDMQARPPQPHHRIIALDGQCIGQVTRFEESPAGGGWWELGIVIYDPAHWGGGLPFYELMPEIGLALRNVTYDTAASTYLYRPQVFDIVARIVGADRVVWGSDYPVLGQRRFLDAARQWLPEEAVDPVLGGNAARLYGLRVPEVTT